MANTQKSILSNQNMAKSWQNSVQNMGICTQIRPLNPTYMG